MDISNSLGSAEKIKETLKKFPKHSRCSQIEEWYPKSVLEDAKKDLMRKCIPFISKVMKEIKTSIESFNEETIQRMQSRKEYIQRQLENAREEKEVQSKKNKIISEIECLEKLNIQPFEKMMFDENKSLSIIEYLFESCESSVGNQSLKNFIELAFEKDISNRTDSYEKILQILQNGQQ